MRQAVKFVQFAPAGSPLRTPQLSASHLVDTGSFGNITPDAVLISVEEDNVRFTWDGTAPSGSTGLRLMKDEQPWLWRGPTGSMAFLGESGSGYVNLGLFVT